jgi:hypothetical protein
MNYKGLNCKPKCAKNCALRRVGCYAGITSTLEGRLIANAKSTYFRSSRLMAVGRIPCSAYDNVKATFHGVPNVTKEAFDRKRHKEAK